MPPTAAATAVAERVDALDWRALGERLDADGFAVTEPLLSASECAELAALFEDGRFRSTVDMARHRFGDGRYRYFDHPLPDAVQQLRRGFYRHLAPIANRWWELLEDRADAFPLEHEELLERCARAGQTRPTPLILRYGEGDWNALHKDLYGEVYSPSRCSRSCPSPPWTSAAASSCCSSSARAPRAARTSSSPRAARS